MIAAVLLLARPSWALLLAGASIAATGEVIRMWAVSHVGSRSRTRGEAVGPLIVTGPFARTRNPLYLGNLLLAAGLALASGVSSLVTAVVLLVGLQYACIVAWEETRLERSHGSEYRAYRAAVPRWFPRPGRAKVAPPGLRLEWPAVIRSERSTLVAHLALWAALIGVAWSRGDL